MTQRRTVRPGENVRVLVLGTTDPALRGAVRERLSRPRGRGRASPATGRHSPFKVLFAGSAAEIRRRATPAVTAIALDLALRGTSPLDLIRGLRETRPEIALLAFARGAPTSDAIATLMAGADFFHACAAGDCAGLERAVELAIDRRSLSRVIERNQEETEAARGRLAQLSGDLVLAVPGFRPLHAPEDVLPFREAARRYLLAAVQLFEGDARGLARALGVSYFALRRLLARYQVPFPAARSRR